MASTEALICSPANDTVWTDTVSMTSENSLYPATNIKTNNPQEVARSTGTGSTFTFTHAGAMTSAPIVGVTIHNHKLVGATVTFAGVSVPIPARSSDGQCTNVFLDRRLSPIGAAGSHDLVVSGAASGFGIGRVCIATVLSPVRFHVEASDVEWSTDWPNSTEQGYYYAELTYDKGVRVRRVKGLTRRGADQATLYAVVQAAKGQNLPFIFVPDSAVNESWFAVPEASILAWRQATVDGRVLTLDLALREVSMGLPL